jgi:hypothetical protein
MIGLLFFLIAVYFYPGKWRYLSIFILFFLVTAGFQMIPLKLAVIPQLGIAKPYDWAYLFIGFLFLIQPRIYLNSPVWKNFPVVMGYGAVLILLFINSYFFNDIELSVSIRVLRNFFIFIVLFLFVRLTREEHIKILRLIIYATCLASLLYCMQPLLNVTLLNRITSEIQEFEGAVISRYYNVPVFIYPVIFFLFFPKEVFGLRFRPVLLLIALLTIGLTQHRNLIIVIAVCYLLYVIFSNRVKHQHALIYLMTAIAVFFAADLAMKGRLTEGIENISELKSANVKFRDVVLSDLSTTEFRKLILEERLSFILEDESRAVLGIGLMTDDSKKARPLKFNVGVPDDEGNISQISNIDIAWASMLLQFGLLGTLAFLLVYISLLRKFCLFRRDPYMLTGAMYIVSLLITSLYGSVIAMPYVTCLVMLFASYHYKLQGSAANVKQRPSEHPDFSNHLTVQV